MKRKWTPEEIRSQGGKFAVVTGGTDGLGFQIALELARNGAHIILGSDHRKKGEWAVEQIRRRHAPAIVEFAHLNLSDLRSVEEFANQVQERDRGLDLLVNNAGITGVPHRALSADGFELQFATNFLGPFALTGRLLRLLRLKPLSRVVTMCSLSHRHAELRFDDLQAQKHYDPQVAYGQSKLADLVFAFELHRRARAAGLSLLSIPVHPGGAKTNIFNRGPYLNGSPSFTSRVLAYFILSVGQSAAQGAWPALFAATSPDAKSGVYYGPGGLKELRGFPAIAKVAPQATRRADAERLWEVAESLTGVDFGLAPVPSRRTSRKSVMEEASPAFV